MAEANRLEVPPINTWADKTDPTAGFSAMINAPAGTATMPVATSARVGPV